MTPEEHIEQAEKYLDRATTYGYSGDTLTAMSNAALAHIEMAKWKESHEEARD